ncbi:hypothetical protein AX16_000613 [Volvariella volvacea WC 439]|nr:hypothetical protein AX16_000613 [Volvariella volvacea WC 439]
MPAERTVAMRRSRRISNQERRNYNEEWSEDDIVPYQKSAKRRKISVDDRQGLTVSASPSEAPYTPSPTSSPRLRASHARKRGAGYVSRPPNAFMLFRSEFWAKEKLKPEPIERDHRDISRIAAHCWNQLDEKERTRFQKMAEERKQQHRQQHPDYKYAPMFRKKPGKRKPKKSRTAEEERCRKLASIVMGNVVSAPDNFQYDLVPTPGLLIIQASSSNQRLDAQRATPSPLAKAEEPNSPYLSFDITDAQSDGGFVPTDDIPPLALPQAASGMKETRRTTEKRQKHRNEQTPLTPHILPDRGLWFDGPFLGVHDSGLPLSIHPSAMAPNSIHHYSAHSPLVHPTYDLRCSPSQDSPRHQESANTSGYDTPKTPTTHMNLLQDAALDFDVYVKFDD